MHLRYLALGLAVSPALSLAATPSTWQVCPPNNKPNITVPRPADLDPEAVYVEADTADLQEQGESTLEGDVIIAQTKQGLLANKASYNRQTQQVKADGNVRLSSETLELNSDKIDYNFGTQAGEIFDAYYRLPASDSRGKSAYMMRAGKELTRLEQATYTTCPPNNESWKLEASSIELRHQQSIGVARNVKFRIKDMTVFYFPYFSFPLDTKRKSGFLVPQFKSDANSGVQFGFPYYFNLAPNYDATVTPIVMSQRGLGVNTEFRYLQPAHNGTFVFNAVPSDRKKDGKFRYQFDISHNTTFDKGRKGNLSIKAGGVSDNDYLDDFGGSLAATSTVNLERNITYTIAKQNWSFTAIAQDFQVLTTDTDAYTRLPQFTFNFTPNAKPAGIHITTESEFTNFYSANQANAKRLNLKVKATRPIEKEWGFVRPSVTLNHTNYKIDRDTDSTIQRTLPTASLDTGLIYERKLGDHIVQTLEPRAFYTYTPYKDQSNIPIFDTSEKTLTYSELFSDNRFTGRDRINDANRLTASVTTRFQDTKTGRERLRASVGQIHYFDKRQVTLPDKTAETGKRSELVFEVSGELNARTRATSTAYYDTNNNSLTATLTELNYKDAKNRLLNVSYDKRKDSYEAAGISAATPINKNWKAIGAWNYDLANNRTLETVGGLEYESCCWKTRLAARRYLQSDNSTFDNALFVEFELKGLGSLGSSASDLLRNRVIGYQ